MTFSPFSVEVRNRSLHYGVGFLAIQRSTALERDFFSNVLILLIVVFQMGHSDFYFL